MLELPDSWVWDFWIADTGTEYHLFFLFASRALRHEELRHRRASVGHAVSADLVTWRRLPDALVRSDPPAFDDVATWTGSTVRADDGRWHLFYTGLSDSPVRDSQAVLSAVSDDLMTWTKTPALVVADPRFYSTGEQRGHPAWRDPWVFRHEDGRWHMLLTARDRRDADVLGSGVLGHAVSDDLLSWEVLRPLTEPGAGFGQLEVPQVVEVDGRTYLLANCLNGELDPSRRTPGGGGVWIVPADGALGPFHLGRAALITDSSRYVGKALRDRTGEWQFLAFRNVEDGEFIGALADPVPFRPEIEAVLGVPRE